MTRETLSQTARRLGALTLLVVGLVHLQQYYDGYSEIDVIGPLFMLNFAGATVMAAALFLPTERFVPRWGSLLVVLSALGGVALSATSFVMLLIAQRRPLFGFREPGFDPGAILLSQVFEIATVVLLGAFLVLTRIRAARGGSVARAHRVSARGRSHATRRAVAPVVLGVVALALAACGDGGGTTTESDSGSGASTGDDAGAGDTVSVADIDGQSVLVDADGVALYTSEQESGGDLLCISEGCTAFWIPLTVDGEEPTGDVSGELGTVSRPDGSTQVTLDGVPLYSFSEDDAGQVNGDDLSDTFDGQTLTWHVAVADGPAPEQSGTPDDEETSDGGGGYSY